MKDCFILSDAADIPAGPSVDRKKSKRKDEYKKVIWKNKNLKIPEEQIKYRGSNSLSAEIMALATPYQFFSFFLNDELLNLISEETHRHSIQKDPSQPLQVSITDVQHYIGICYLMSLIHLPSARDYWSHNLGNQIIKETMSLKEFEKIRQFLHFNDNTKEIPRGMNGHDRLFKVRPLIESIRKRFMQVTMKECLSIDEQICATKSRSMLKQYLPKKPHKWGFKFFVLCGISGFAYDFELYSGQENGAIRPPNEPDLGSASNVVVRLSRQIPRNQNHKLFFDNYFNSLPLLEFLSQNGILSLGTVRRNRFPNCKLPLESEMKKEKRGYSLEQVACINSTEISCVTWLDNKPVNVLSTFVGSLPIENISRFDIKLNTKTDISCPFVVKQYNKHMGWGRLIRQPFRKI